MVPLGLGLAIIGGSDKINKKKYKMYKEVYALYCSNKICEIQQFGSKLKVARGWFVAIPMPDIFPGCITEGKGFKIIQNI